MNIKRIIILTPLFFIGILVDAQNNCVDSDSLKRELTEVVVTARQPATKLEGTTLVSYIAGSKLADVGNALDVLALLPMLKVEDSAVNVIGKNNVEIYIDGRPMRDDRELQQLLSVNLKKVELMMAPGAEYSSTTDAVLKITTKKNFKKGLSFSDQLQIQKRRKWSVLEYASLAYQFGKWEFFVNGSINRNNTLTKGVTLNKLWYNDRETIIGSSQHNHFPTTAGTVKSGFNYNNDNLFIGGYYRYNPEYGDFCNTGEEWYDDSPTLDRVIDKTITAYNHLGSIYLEKQFDNNVTLHFDGDYRRAYSTGDVVTSYPNSLNQEVSSSETKKSTLLAGRLYMNFPLWNGSFAVGTQDSYTRTNLDYLMKTQQVESYLPSSVTSSTQTSLAVYASWRRSFRNFSLVAGARYEHVDYEYMVDGKKDENVSRLDNLLTPDISLGYSFNDNSQITLSYKMATIRPPYAQLTGALNYVGLHEIEGGNPSLRDERMHNLQFFSSWNGFLLQADMLRSINTYAYVKDIYPAQDLQLIMHPVNIDLSVLSLYLVWTQPVGFWTPNVTTGVYKQWLELKDTKYDKPLFSYYFDNTFTLPGNWIITAEISGRLKGDMHTNRFGSTYFTMDASIAKMLFNKSLTLKLKANNIFNTSNNNWSMNTNGISVDKRQSYDYRGVSLSIIYNFQPSKSKYKGSTASESEMNRL